MKFNAFRLISWLTIAIGMFLMVYVAYQLFYPFKISESRFQVLSPVVKTGGNLALKVDYCKYMDLQATTIRELQGEAIIELPPTTTNLSIGCTTINRLVPLPTGIPSGTYRYKTTVIYKVSSLREVRHSVTSTEFYVTN